MIVDYPSVAFAFNPISIKVSGLNQSSRTTLTYQGKGLSREVVNGSATYNVQAFALSLFDRKAFYNVQTNDNTLYKVLNLSIFVREDEEGEGDSMDISIGVIWGALQIGEVYSQSKTLYWFKHFPFTVPLFLQESNTVKMRYDKNGYVDHATLTGGKYNLAVPVDASKEVAFRIDNGHGTFNYKFSRTFRAVSVNDILIRLIVVECTDGIYLRWINRYGEHCYYLFESGSESNAIKNIGADIQEFYTTINPSDNYHPGTNHAQGKTGQRSVKLFAPLVDRDAYRFLESLTESAVVDLFTGYKDGSPQWVGVNIAPASLVRNESVLQDFECTLIYPSTQLQAL